MSEAALHDPTLTKVRQMSRYVASLSTYGIIA